MNFMGHQMQLQDDLKNWDQILAKCLDDLKIKYPRFNESQIADQIGIARATFNRITNSKKLPRLSNVIKLLASSGNHGVLETAITLHDSELAPLLKNTLSVASEQENKIVMDRMLENLFEDRDIFITYMLTSTSNGISRTDLINVLGNSGLEAVAVLIDKKLVEGIGEYYKITNDAMTVRSFDSVKKHLSTYARFYKTEHVGMNWNYVHSFSNGRNKTGVEKIRDIHRRYHKELQEAFNDKSLEGGIPYFSVGFCDSFTSIDSHQNPSEQGLIQ